MAKLFVASVRCPSCSQANDLDFRFCQRCGYKRKITTPLKHGSLDSKSPQAIDDGLQKLKLFSQATERFSSEGAGEFSWFTFWASQLE